MQARRFSLLSLLFWTAIAFTAAIPGMLFPPDGWYRRIVKPDWTPPDWLFGPVWTTLYLLLGISTYLVVRRFQHPDTPRALVLFFVQLMLNAAWTPLFFGAHRPDLALACIGLLWVTLVAVIVNYWRVRPVAGALQLPYLAWISFATALNAAIWQLNR